MACGLWDYAHLVVRERRTGRVKCRVQQGSGEIVQGQVAVDVGVEVEGGVGRRCLAVCEELVSNSGRRCSVEATGGWAGCRGGGRGARVLVAHVALAGMLDRFYLRVGTRVRNPLCNLYSEVSVPPL